MYSKGAPRRRHSKELKAVVLAACSEPGSSVAAVAQLHGLNANLVHKWRRGSHDGATPNTPPAAGASVTELKPSVFVPLQIPARPSAAPADIRIELRRGSTTINVSWPIDAASYCASWMRELLR